MGDRQTDQPHSPLTKLVSKLTLCEGITHLRYVLRVSSVLQSDQSSSRVPSESPPPRAARLFSPLWHRSWAVCSEAMPNFACTGYSEVVAPTSQLCYVVSKRSPPERLGKQRRRHATSGACAGHDGSSHPAGLWGGTGHHKRPPRQGAQRPPLRGSLCGERGGETSPSVLGHPHFSQSLPYCRALHASRDRKGSTNLRLFRPNLQAGSFPAYKRNSPYPPEIL